MFAILENISGDAYDLCGAFAPVPLIVSTFIVPIFSRRLGDNEQKYFKQISGEHGKIIDFEEVEIDDEDFIPVPQAHLRRSVGDAELFGYSLFSGESQIVFGNREQISQFLKSSMSVLKENVYTLYEALLFLDRPKEAEELFRDTAALPGNVDETSPTNPDDQSLGINEGNSSGSTVDKQVGHFAAIEEVLENYSSNVIPALEAVITIDDAFPKEVLNELRNSYTHLARSVRYDPGTSDHQREIKAAQTHLDRTAVDCLKVAVFSLAQRTERRLETYDPKADFLPETVCSEISDIRQARRKLQVEEALGDLGQRRTVYAYSSILNRLDALYRSIEERQIEARLDSKARNKIRWLHRVFALRSMPSLLRSIIRWFD